MNCIIGLVLKIVYNPFQPDRTVPEVDAVQRVNICWNDVIEIVVVVQCAVARIIKEANRILAGRLRVFV